jgi:hypothetical protein
MNAHRIIAYHSNLSNTHGGYTFTTIKDWKSVQ